MVTSSNQRNPSIGTKLVFLYNNREHTQQVFEASLKFSIMGAANESLFRKKKTRITALNLSSNAY